MRLVLNVLAILAAILGGVASMGAIPMVSAELGAFIIAGAGAALVMIKVIGDYLDNKIMDDSFKADGTVKKIVDAVVGFFKK